VFAEVFLGGQIQVQAGNLSLWVEDCRSAKLLMHRVQKTLGPIGECGAARYLIAFWTERNRNHVFESKEPKHSQLLHQPILISSLTCYCLPFMQPNACTVRKVKEDMSKDGKKGDFYPSERPKGAPLLPPEILDIIKPALQVGGLSGKSIVRLGLFVLLVKDLLPLPRDCT
jgi:hypothetical protein